MGKHPPLITCTFLHFTFLVSLHTLLSHPSSNMGSVSSPNIHVVLPALPAFGHVRPAIILANKLLALNYTVTVVTGTNFRERIEAIKGVEFVPLKGEADFDFDVPLAERFPERPKENTVLYDMEKVFYHGFADQCETVKEVIERPDLLNRQTVIVQDGSKYNQEGGPLKRQC